MEKQHLQELDYGITIAVNTMVTAMGMQAENERCKYKGESLTYNEGHFQELIEKNGVHHNNILTRWQEL